MPAEEVICAKRMERPKRQAAVAALQKMHRIREWEELPENSKRFRECAAAIEAEFRNEERFQNVRAEDIASDIASNADEESSDEYMSANESFVSSESVSESSEYVPDAEETVLADAEEEYAEESDVVSEEENSECLSDEESSTSTLNVATLSQASTPEAENVEQESKQA